jgi:hypothetical protein
MLEPGRKRSPLSSLVLCSVVWPELGKYGFDFNLRATRRITYRCSQKAAGIYSPGLIIIIKKYNKED